MAAVTGAGLRSANMISSLVTMRNQLADLQRQIGTGKKSTDYAGLGVNRGLAVGLHAHLATLQAYGDTMTNVGVRISITQSVLQRLSDIGREVKGAVSVSSTNSAQMTQQLARNDLGEMLSLLNTQSGDRYLFSGLAADRPAVESVDHVLNGDGARAGLTQIISERNQADLGSNGLGRLVISSPSATSVSVAEDVAGSPFGFKLANVSTTLTGATVSGPAGSPPAAGIDLGATNPNPGETVNFTFTLPDGTSQTLTLTATTSTTPGPNEFTIGADTTVTAGNLQSALTGAIGTLAQTQLAAASAVQASNEFFAADANNPPLRVAGPPFDTATALTTGSAANTVIWYQGEAGASPARGTATAQIDQSISVSYGVRANEQAIRSAVQNVALMAAMSFSATDPNAQARSAALNDRVRPALDVPPGNQKIEDIEADLAGAQSAMTAAKDRQQQANATLSDLLQNIEGVSNDQVSAEILALQTNLQASLQTTALLYKTSILNYI
jgi:flagellar hook-associated protein 3 FlgL